VTTGYDAPMRYILMLVLVLSPGCGRHHLETVKMEEQRPDAAEGVTDPALRDLLRDHWEAAMRSAPLWATTLGDRRFDTELGIPRPNR
jgi:hypothetical protein